MILTALDKKALDIATDTITNCNRYRIPPAPYFPLVIRMYDELLAAGMIQWSEEVEQDAQR